MWELAKAVLFGIVEGITEWLPISSTGHMILLNEFLSLNAGEEFWDMFLVVVQMGAILAVLLLFWERIWPFGRSGKTVVLRKDVIANWINIIIACLPAVVFVVLGLDDFCDAYFYNPVCVAAALILFGIAFLLVEKRNAAQTGNRAVVEEVGGITFQMAALIGLFQLLAAAFPGTSRSGATIIGALLIGISRKAASEFTFILAIPVMLGASLLEVMDFGFSLTKEQWMLLLGGMVSAFLVSIIVIRFLLDYIRKHDFRVFGWYRIVLGALVLVYFYVF